MAFFEKTTIADSDSKIINPATEDTLSLLKRIFLLLKPLGVISGGGSNRLQVEVVQPTAASLTATVSIAAAQTLTTVTNVGTLATLSNQTNMGGVTAFDLVKAMNRTGYNSGIRSNISFT
jgi:hypothetical protein